MRRKINHLLWLWLVLITQSVSPLGLPSSSSSSSLLTETPASNKPPARLQLCPEAIERTLLKARRRQEEEAKNTKIWRTARGVEMPDDDKKLCEVLDAFLSTVEWELETEDSIADLQSLSFEVYQRAHFLNPLNPEYDVRLGMLAMSTSNPLHPYLPSLLLCLPSPLPCTDDTEPSQKFSTDRMEEARSFFERALRLCPDHPVALCQIAMMKEAAGEVQEACDLVERASTKSPNDTNVLGELARLNKKLNRYDRSLQLYQESLCLQPDNMDTMSNYAALLSSMKSKGFVTPEDPQEVFNRILKMNPSQLETICNYAIYLRDEKDDLEGATFLLEKAVRANPDCHRIYHPLAQCYLKAKDFKTAEEALLHALQLVPSDTQMLGAFLSFPQGSIQDLEQASERINQASLERPADDELSAVRAWFYLSHLNDKEEAELTMEKAIGRDPTNVHLAVEFGQILLESRQDGAEAAEAVFRNAVFRHPDDPYAHCCLANICWMFRRDKTQAAVHYNKALELDPSFQLARKNYDEMINGTEVHVSSLLN